MTRKINPEDFDDLMKHLAELPDSLFERGTFTVNLNGLEVAVAPEDVQAAKLITWLFDQMRGDTTIEHVIKTLQSALFWVTLTSRVAMAGRVNGSGLIIASSDSSQDGDKIDFGELNDWLNDHGDSGEKE